MVEICINLNSFDYMYIEKAKKQIVNTILFLESMSPLFAKSAQPSQSSWVQHRVTSLSPKLTLQGGKTDLDSNIVNFTKKIIPLPTSRNKLTILTSPHIDKKSREQFESRCNKIRIQTRMRNSRKTYYFLTLLKNLKISGVEITISLRFASFFLFLDSCKS